MLHAKHPAISPGLVQNHPPGVTLNTFITQEVGVAHEEALVVVVAVDEPAGDLVRATRPHLARLGIEVLSKVLGKPLPF